MPSTACHETQIIKSVDVCLVHVVTHDLSAGWERTKQIWFTLYYPPKKWLMLYFLILNWEATSKQINKQQNRRDNQTITLPSAEMTFPDLTGGRLVSSSKTKSSSPTLLLMVPALRVSSLSAIVLCHVLGCKKAHKTHGLKLSVLVEGGGGGD